MKDRAYFAMVYPHQIGFGTYKGCLNLALVLRAFAESGLSADEVNCNKLIAIAAKQRNVLAYSAKQAIDRYIKGSWQCFKSDWKHYTGWDKETPPDVDTAIRLLCMSLDRFVDEVLAEIEKRKNESET